MRKILLVGTNRGMVSGVSTHLNQLFSSELANKYEIQHFIVGNDGTDESILAKIKRFVVSPISLLRAIKRYSPDLVHLNPSMDLKSFFRDTAYLLVAKMLSKKVLFQLHGGVLSHEFFSRNSMLYLVRKKILEMADGVVLLTSLEKKSADGFCDFRLLKVIPNAIDVQSYSGQRVFDNGDINLVYIGRLVDAKGIREGIEALSILMKDGFTNIRFRIAGTGPYENALKKEAKRLGVESAVEFLGPIFGDDKAEFWREADILVFPSYFEGLPYAIIEALASGTPIVATKIGGMQEAIDQGVHGYFVELRDPRSIAVAVKKMLSDKEAFKLMSEACRRRAEEQFSLKRLSNQFDDTYQSIIQC